MTQEQKTATLTTVFSEILADLAFMLSDDRPEDASSVGDIWLETRIAYSGSQSAELRFWCTREFSVQLATNLLGIVPDDDGAETQGVDAVKEFMNIVCGQLITALHGTQAVFDLTIPGVRELPGRPSLPEEDGPHSSTLFVDGQRLHLSLTPRGTAALDA